MKYLASILSFLTGCQAAPSTDVYVETRKMDSESTSHLDSNWAFSVFDSSPTKAYVNCDKFSEIVLSWGNEAKTIRCDEFKKTDHAEAGK